MDDRPRRHPLQLDEPSEVRRASAWLAICASAGYLLLAVAINRMPHDVVVVMPSVVLAHSVSMALVATITAIVLYLHAARSSNVGYLILAGTFVTSMLVTLAVPFAFPGGLVQPADGPPTRLLGGLQSSVTLFYCWHLVLYLGLPTAAAVLAWAADRPRRKLKTSTIVASALASAAVGVSIAAWALFAPDSLPTFITEEGIAGLAVASDWLLLSLSVVGLVVIVVVTRERTVISRWVTAVAVLYLGAAIVNLGVERYSIGWYFTRTFGLLAMSTLLIALVLQMARVDRVTLDVASHDGLTQVLSRDAFEDALAREVSRAVETGELLALLWMDVDGFKGVNDRHGHQAGDEVLRAVARRAHGQIRESDLIGRMGGDEFAILLPGVGTPEAAMSIACRIASTVSGPITVVRQTVAASCSIGVAFAPAHATTSKDLAYLADVAMYAAKLKGGNQVSVADGIPER